MLYRILLIAILLALPVESNLLGFDQEKIYGGFTKCTKYLYDYQNGQLDSTSKRIDEICKYDENGYKIEMRQYYLEAPIGYICNWKYDRIGNKLEESSSLANGTRLWKKTYKYDNNRNAIERMEFGPKDSVLEKYTFCYNDKRQEIDSIFYYDDGTIKKRDSTWYHQNGTKSVIINYNYRLDRSLEGCSQYNYDSTGNRTEQRFRKYDETGKLIEDILNKFTSPTSCKSYNMLNPKDSDEEMGFSEEDVMIDVMEIFEKTTYEYDDNGRTIAQLEYKSEAVVSRKDTYKYDELGNIIESVYYNPNIPVTKTVYIYSK
jgi:hypothetical protein